MPFARNRRIPLVVREVELGGSALAHHLPRAAAAAVPVLPGAAGRVAAVGLPGVGEGMAAAAQILGSAGDQLDVRALVSARDVPDETGDRVDLSADIGRLLEVPFEAEVVGPGILKRPAVRSKEEAIGRRGELV